MDLRSVLNTSDAGERPPSHEPPTPQQQPQPPPPPRPSPSAVQYAFHNYAQPPPDPPAPAKEHGQEYSSQAQRHASNTFPPPSPYQGSGTYPPHSSAAPPAHLSHPSDSFHDVLSPTSKTAQVPSQSPYRSSLTPNSAHTKAPAYPFPSQDVASPSQQPQFPSGQGHYHQLQQRQGSVSLPLSTKPSGPYVQHSTVPHTTGAGTSGCSPSYPYHHTRSQSTSVSAQSAAEIQRPLGPSHGHGSPMDASQQPPSAEFERQRSQPPPIPIGSSHPTAGLRHTSAAGETGQSSSPCSQRSPFTGVAQPILAQPIAAITSPSSPTMPLPIQRLSGALGACDSPTSDPHSRPRSHQDRDRSDRNSVSVSPRTRLASLSSNTGRPSVSGAETDSGKPSPGLQSMSIDLENAVTPAKRKLADRSMSPRELDRHESRPAPGETEDSSMGRIPMTAPRSAVRRTGRRPYAQPPIWAQSARILAGKMPKHPNFVLQTRAHQQLPLSNGTQDGHGKQETLSRPSSPEAGRSRQGEGDSQSQGPQAILETGPQSILGPWEASIMGVKPYEELSKTVADFIFINVVTNNDFKEIISRGIQFEIEAKLGTLIDKDTNVRVDKLLDTECILHDTGRIAFRSSTTEAHHKAFNDFLNQVVIETYPRAPNGANRVQVQCKHRREVDRFLELPFELQNQLPGCMRSRLGSRGRNARVRVTYDQKTGEILHKIVKARVSDMDLHMPSCPMDCRLSINLEMDWDGSVEELEQVGANQSDKQADRSKDRLSYSQGHYQIDLTQVTQVFSGPGASQRVEKEHELEVELAAGIVIEQGTKAMSGEPHRYQELVEGLLDNVRVLARKAKEF